MQGLSINYLLVDLSAYCLSPDCGPAVPIFAQPRLKDPFETSRGMIPTNPEG